MLVSELLGSFGDNELSPECLDGAMRLLRPGGISIPSSYTSFAAPLTTPKLWNCVKSQGTLAAFETPYVVSLFQHSLVASPCRCFTFVHDLKDMRNKEGVAARSAVTDFTRNTMVMRAPTRAAVDNTRHQRLSFVAKQNSTIHGVAGYFESTLFEKVRIGINPLGEDNCCYSWFPIYFPLRIPVTVAEGALVEIEMWRCVSRSQRKVWYEWALISPVVTPIHNVNGRSYWIGL